MSFWKDFVGTEKTVRIIHGKWAIRFRAIEVILYVKLKDWMSNSIDPDESSHLDLHCLQKPIIIAYGSERVKADVKFFRAQLFKANNVVT